MKIIIAGPGAVGQVVGSQLAKGHDVTFLGRPGSERIGQINESGVRLHDLRCDEWITVTETKAVDSLAGEARPADLVILTTKAYSNPHVLRAIGPVVGSGTLLLPLQNGVQSADEIGRIFPDKGVVLGGLCFMGAAVLPNGVVELNAPARVLVGEFFENTQPEVDLVVQAFREAGIATTRSDDIRRDLYLKFLWNVGIFQWCAIYDCTVGELLSDPEKEQQVRQTLREVVLVAQTQGVAISDTDIDPQIQKAKTDFPSVTPSLLQDLRAGRRTEVDSFSGFVVSRAPFEVPRNAWLFAELQRLSFARDRLSSSPQSKNWTKEAFSTSHVGTRPSQQDRVWVEEIGDFTVAVVCDGHGLVGDRVSKDAADAFVSCVERLLETEGGNGDDLFFKRILNNAVEVADENVMDWLSREFPPWSQHADFASGTTLLGLIRRGSEAWLAHVGDSRAYFISRQDRRAMLLTRDHRWTEVDGQGREVEVDYNHGLGISRALGQHWLKAEEKIQARPDVIKIEGLARGDVLVLCSDGINLTEDEIAEIVLGGDAETAPQRLVRASLEKTEREIALFSIEQGDADEARTLTIDNVTALVLT